MWKCDCQTLVEDTIDSLDELGKMSEWARRANKYKISDDEN